MMFYLSCLLILLFTANAERVQMEPTHRQTLVEDWMDMGPSNLNMIHSVGFVFKTNSDKREALETLFWQLSDPQDPAYGEYISQEEVRSYLEASPAALRQVTEWLMNAEAQNLEQSKNRDIIWCSFTISQLQDLLQTEFRLYYSEKYNLRINRAIAGYSLPAEVAQHLSLVDGLTMFPGLRLSKTNKASTTGFSASGGSAEWPDYCPDALESACKGKLTPNITALIYNSYPLTSAASFQAAEGNGFAIAEFQGELYNPEDFGKFGEACGVPVVNVTDINGDGTSTSYAGIETMLDVEYIAGNGLNIPLTNFYSEEYSLLKWADQVNGQGDGAPLVYSVSYGNDERQQVSTDYMFQVNTAFMAAATRGFTVLFASGDQGVWGRSGIGAEFHPDFPASSPYITSVGGTDFVSGAPTLDSHEEKCSKDGGGGFSNTFDMPSYQADAVQQYLQVANETLPKASLFNVSGRAYPDISADFGLTISYCVRASGMWTGVAGTSASCPTVAHGIAVLNNLQLAAGKKPLGFLNQWLYQTHAAHQDAFTDITQGENNHGLFHGFSAAAGWDPCSGVGTPDFQAMSKYLP